MRPAVPWRFAALACLLSIAGAGNARGEAYGFGELRLSVFPGAAGKKWQLIERVRPTFQAAVADRVALAAELEVGLQQGRDMTTVLRRQLQRSDLGPLLDHADCQWPEHANARLGIDGARDYLEVDRLYLDIYSKHADIRIGRQAVNWGSAQFLNPTDPFPEVLFAEPWRPRRGVNALRVIVPFGSLNDITGVMGINDTLDEALAAARLRVNWLQTDWALVGAWRTGSDTGFVGADLRGTFGVGWWLEAALNLHRDGRTPYEALTAGIDYSFPVFQRLIVFAQYHRNGSGAPDVDARQLSAHGPIAGVADLPACDGLSLFGGRPAARRRNPFAPFTRGRDYLMLGTQIAFDEYLSGSVFALQNLNDGSALLAPTLGYLALAWLEVTLTAQIPVAMWGGGGELSPAASDLVLQTPGGLGAVDLSGLVPAATLVVWTRARF